MPDAEVEGVQCVLLDIEGTICPISFVKETLFPYALEALPRILPTHWDSAEFIPYRDAFPEEHRSTPEALLAHVQDLTARDVKIAYLKDLQGYLWEEGYQSGIYATPLFGDVVPALRKWHKGKEGKGSRDIAIYSSGSVRAQKLLFGFVKNHAHSENGAEAGSKRERKDEGSEKATRKQTRLQAAKVAETPVRDGDAVEKVKTDDLTYLISGWFDSTNAGPKVGATSYQKIAGDLKYDANAILFLSDNVKEVDAAIVAGMKSILVDRPGNAPVADSDRKRLTTVTSLDQIKLLESKFDSKATAEDAEAGEQTEISKAAMKSGEPNGEADKKDAQT